MTRAIRFTLATAVASVWFTFGTAEAHAQASMARNAIYGELGGNALAYSINYDRRLKENLTGRSTTVGFRYQPVNGGLVFRASLTPFYSREVQLWGGLSLGYAF